MTIEEHLRSLYGITAVECRDLHTPTNDVFDVASSDGSRYALKVYNASSRTYDDVMWEAILVEHLAASGAPVVRPIGAGDNSVSRFELDGDERVAVLSRWADGARPQPSIDSYRRLGRAAAMIHAAADSFTLADDRPPYDESTLIDDQLDRMRSALVIADQWDRLAALTERLRVVFHTPGLDVGVCHMDLTFDNVRTSGADLIVFDFDSSSTSWRAIEPHMIYRASPAYFRAWLQGYREVRPFSTQDERAAAAFAIIGEIRNVTWDLGYAASSRGVPLLNSTDLPAIIDRWEAWEVEHVLD